MTVQRGLPAYDGIGDLPPLVAQAVKATRDIGDEKACIPEVGRLLHLLVSSRTGIRVGETGTACGVGAAWIASALEPTSTLTTVELDAERAAIAARILDANDNVRVLCGDWSSINQHGPFDIFFVDGGPAKTDTDDALALVGPRGLLAFDDLTPEHAWSEEQRREYYGGDPVRKAWAARSDCVTVEVMVTPSASVMLVARLT